VEFTVQTVETMMTERMTIEEIENWHSAGINHNEPELWAEYADENIQSLFDRITELEAGIVKANEYGVQQANEINTLEMLLADALDKALKTGDMLS
jgi:hypothetical protein